jgi:hypothetical protein
LDEKKEKQIINIDNQIVFVLLKFKMQQTTKCVDEKKTLNCCNSFQDKKASVELIKMIHNSRHPHLYHAYFLWEDIHFVKIQ